MTEVSTGPNETGSRDAPAYEPPSNVVDVNGATQAKKSMHTRVLPSFKRRDDAFALNGLGQQVVDAEKGGDTSTLQTRDTSRLKRKLKGRHMQMIAIGGAIGTGTCHVVTLPI